jgi:hypothetical protein
VYHRSATAVNLETTLPQPSGTIAEHFLRM